MAMIIELLTTLSLRCPVCGKLEIHPIHIFDFSGRQSKDIFCECGYKKVRISTKDFKRFSMKFNCIICEVEHTLLISAEEFWGQYLSIVRCPDTDLKLGYLGPDLLVQNEIRDQQDLDDMLKDSDFEDYFCDPEVMLGVLDILHDIAEAGGLFCQCGNHKIDIDMYPDKVELNCRECHGLITINARTANDLAKLKEQSRIVITKGKTAHSDPI